MDGLCIGSVSASSRQMRAMSDEAFVLAETGHRVANELAAALAALRLVKSARGSRSRWALLGDAIERLEGFAVTHRLFTAAVYPDARVDVGEALGRLCTALAAARRSASGSEMTLDLPTTFVDGATARSLALVANELVTNAIKYALDGRAGIVLVSLKDDGERVHLVVSDDGPGFDASAAPEGTGMGSGIVSELVRRAGGGISVKTGREGTTYQVSLPHTDARDA